VQQKGKKERAHFIVRTILPKCRLWDHRIGGKRKGKEKEKTALQSRVARKERSIICQFPDYRHEQTLENRKGKREDVRPHPNCGCPAMGGKGDNSAFRLYTEVGVRGGN